MLACLLLKDQEAAEPAEPKPVSISVVCTIIYTYFARGMGAQYCTEHICVYIRVYCLSTSISRMSRVWTSVNFPYMLPVCTFLVLAHLGSPGKRAIKCACVCVLPVIMMTVILCTTGFVDDVCFYMMGCMQKQWDWKTWFKPYVICLVEFIRRWHELAAALCDSCCLIMCNESDCLKIFISYELGHLTLNSTTLSALAVKRCCSLLLAFWLCRALISILCDVPEEKEEEAVNEFVQVSVICSSQASVEVCCWAAVFLQVSSWAIVLSLWSFV